MIEVTKEQFYTAIGPLDVHPRVHVESFKEPQCQSTWELRNRTVVGRSWARSSDGRLAARYELSPAFVKAARAAS